MRIFIFLCTMLLLSSSGLGQPWMYDFDKGTGIFTSSTASTTFLHTPPSGTARVRVGTNPGSIVMANPGLPDLGIDTELQITSNTGSTSTTKFSVYDYTAGKTGYVKFCIAFAGGTDGVYNFTLGDGANFSDNSALGAAHIFSGLRWSLETDNRITYNVLDNTTWGSTTGLTNPTTLFTQSTSTVYLVEVYANNTTLANNYDRAGTTYSLPADKWDLWVDGVRVGTALASGALSDDSNIDSFAFNHQASASDPGTIHIDDIEYSNALPVSTVNPPSISNIVQTPDYDIRTTTTVSVSADVTEGDAAITKVELRWGTATGTYTNTIAMTAGADKRYTANSPVTAQAEGTTVYYVVYAEDNDNESATSAEQSYTAGDPLAMPYTNEFRTQADIDLAVSQGFTIHDAQNETGGDGYLRIFPDGYAQTPKIDFTNNDWLDLVFSATTYGGDLGQTLTVKISVDDGESYTDFASYTLDGNNTRYGAVLNLIESFNVTAGKIKIEMTAGTGSSRFRDFSINLYPVAELAFNPPAGTYSEPIDVDISTATSGATIYYTINGADPDETSIEYTAPIVISSNTTLKAKAYKEGYGPGKIKTAAYSIQPIRKWSGLANTNNWGDADNWSPAGIPNPTDVVILDNAIVTNDFTVNFPGGATTVEIVSLEIIPAVGKAINLNMPDTNTANPGLRISGTGDALIINEGGLFKNATGASAGSGFELTGLGGKIRINNGGHYIHNTIRAHATAIVAKLSVAEGTESGVFKFDVPSTGMYSISATNRTYGSLMVSGATAGSKTYEFSGVNPLNIRGSLDVKENAILHTNMSGIITITEDLIIDNTGTVNVGEASNVSVCGNIINNAGVDGLVIKDGGSILHHANDVAATAECVIPFNSWQNIGSPVSGMDIIGSDFAPVDNPLPYDFDFYYFDESVAEYPWINLRGPGGAPNTTDFTQFAPGRGYLVAYFDGSFAANPFSFKGSLNNGNIDMSLNYTESANEGWNLIANPYPSGIDWGNLNKSALAENFAHIYDHDANEYIPQEAGVIAANQGFFVKTNRSETFTLINNDRTHGSTDTKENDQQERLVLNLANDTHSSTTTLRLIDGASHGHDRRDASKLFSLADHMPQVYSYTSDEVMVAINSIPTIDHVKFITLGVHIPADGSYTLSASEIIGRFRSSPLYLLNNKSGEVHNLKENPEYRFQATEGDEPALFELWFTRPTNVPQLPAEGLTRIYTHGQTLYLEFEQEATNRTLEMFDISGRKLVRKSLGESRQLSENLNLQTGVYIVRITSATEVETKRIFVE